MISLNHLKLEELADFHFDELVKILNKRISELSNKELRIFLYENLNGIITGKPLRLVRIKRKLDGLNIYKKRSTLVKHLNNVFDYKNFSKKKKRDYCAYKLAKKLNIVTCPYCNRNYTKTVVADRNGLTRPDFDHFLSQKEHPLLALSFYNLIPSCLVCNRTLKRDETFNVNSFVHPFMDDMSNEYRYTYAPEKIEDFLSGRKNISIRYEIDSNNNKVKRKIENHFEIFRLCEIFEEHGDEFNDVFRIRHHFNSAYLRQLQKQFKKIGLKDSDIFTTLFGIHNTRDSNYLRPLSKIKSDLINELFKDELAKSILIWK